MTGNTHSIPAPLVVRVHDKDNRSPWSWIPSLYFAEGLPYIIVMGLSVIMYKRLGISNTDIALYTSWLLLPWVIKPFWSPIVDLLGSKRGWVLGSQFLIGAGLGGVAFTIPMDGFFQASLAMFWLLAFSSATHDIAADGFYMLALSQHKQAWFVGIRSTFYRTAVIVGQGLLIMLAGYLEGSPLFKGFFQTGDDAEATIALAWSLTLFVACGLFLLMFAYHMYALPRPARDTLGKNTSVVDVARNTIVVFSLFFQKKNMLSILAFLLLYRFSEAQLIKLTAPFLLDDIQAGGMQLSTTAVGFAYGTVGMLALTAGGVLGGFLTAQHGLKRWLWPMVIAMNAPNLAYVLLAYFTPQNLILINGAIAIEQFGYGFGFTAYMVFMLYLAKGEHATTHYAIATGFMSLSMMLPGMLSGWLQETLGYQIFFSWVLLATVPSFIVTAMITVDEEPDKQ